MHSIQTQIVPKFCQTVDIIINSSFAFWIVSDGTAQRLFPQSLHCLTIAQPEREQVRRRVVAWRLLERHLHSRHAIVPCWPCRRVFAALLSKIAPIAAAAACSVACLIR